MSGQFADRLDKTLLIRAVKGAEIAIMALAGVGFATRQLPLLLAALFLMGLHSTFFAPAKYGLLPEVLRDDELVGGNALVEMGTFVAILLGTLVAGEMAGVAGTVLLVGAMLGVAVLGLLASLAMPRLPAAAPGLQIDWNPWRSGWENVRAARQTRTVFLSILGISWFWAYGALVLAQLPLYARTVLNADERALTLLLVMFSIGLTVFAIDLYFATPRAPAATTQTAAALLAAPHGWRILADLGLLGVFGGFFIVPLYAMVQQRPPRAQVSRIQSANNIVNGLFMVAAAAVGALALEAGFSVPQLLLFAGILNAGVAIYLYSLVPEFLLRFLAWLLVHVMYRLRVQGLERVPEHGPALLICNHVSYVDAIVIAAACRRPVRFIMDSGIFRIPVLRTIFRGMKAVPIAPRSAAPEVYERAFATVEQELAAGHLVCIFPEGKLTRDGEIDVFRGGLLRILERSPVPVVPMVLSNLWPSMFSRREPSRWKRWPRRLLASVTRAIGEPVAAAAVTLDAARQQVAALRICQ